MSHHLGEAWLILELAKERFEDGHGKKFSSWAFQLTRYRIKQIPRRHVFDDYVPIGLSGSRPRPDTHLSEEVKRALMEIAHGRDDGLKGGLDPVEIRLPGDVQQYIVKGFRQRDLGESQGKSQAWAAQRVRHELVKERIRLRRDIDNTEVLV